MQKIYTKNMLPFKLMYRFDKKESDTIKFHPKY